MANVITKDDPRHPKHPEYGAVAKQREKLKAAQEKQIADEAARKAAEQTAADEAARKA